MLYQKILFQTPGIVFSPKLSVICQPAATMHLCKGRHFKTSWKWQRLCCFLGETSPACFPEEAGVWVYHFSGSSKSYQRFLPSCVFLVSCWNRAQTVFVGKRVGRLTVFLVFWSHLRLQFLPLKSASTQARNQLVKSVACHVWTNSRNLCIYGIARFSTNSPLIPKFSPLKFPFRTRWQTSCARHETQRHKSTACCCVGSYFAVGKNTGVCNTTG